MNRIAMSRHSTHTFEFGNATVMVYRATPDLDKLFRGYYRCDVHPVGGAVLPLLPPGQIPPGGRNPRYEGV